MSFAAGQCVGYQETFVAGRGQDGAYQCALTITTTGLVLTAGSPNLPFVAPAARDHGLPALASSVVATAAGTARTAPTDWVSSLPAALGAPAAG